LDQDGFLWVIKGSKRVDPPTEKQVAVGGKPTHHPNLLKYCGQWYFGKCYRPLDYQPPKRFKNDHPEKKYIWATCVLKGEYGKASHPYIIQDEVDHRISDLFKCEPCGLAGKFLDSLFTNSIQPTDDFTVNFAEITPDQMCESPRESNLPVAVVLKLTGRVLFVQSVDRLIRLSSENQKAINGDQK
jgi:hypothetical protein